MQATSHTVLSVEAKAARNKDLLARGPHTQGHGTSGRELYPEQDLDKGIVGWEGQDDPENPRNYSPVRKWTTLSLISSMTLISPFASSVFAPAASFAAKDFHDTSTFLSTFAVSVYVLGYAIGPLFLSPLSEMYGRRIILNIASIHFVVWQIGCALAPNISALIVFRLFSGMGGSACLTLGGGTIADLFVKEHRGMAMSIFTMGPLFGPVLGPICGGFIAQQAGWRWVFWTLLIAAGTCTACILIFFRETNPTILIRRKTHRLMKELNRTDLHSCYDKTQNGRSRVSIILNALIRPAKMLLSSPIVPLLALYVALIYGCLYLLFTTVTTVFQKTYHWAPDLTGLAYTGLGIGLLCGQILFAMMSDRTIVRLTKANNGAYAPEMRLTLCLPYACFVPISFFWYGWAIQAKVHWIVPIIGLFPFGFGMIGIFISIQTYMVDAYSQFAASAIATITITRSFFGAFLPLAGPAMFDSLGYGWGNSLLGFITLALVPVPIFLLKYGGVLRERFPVNFD
ncbi:MFS general substrate transporter [Rhizodiscina lignyota]|uniref:MFS general substrate transporter n=1 Tax=Rhizodiscina lignyota TaxID=1504668 RepID=A0A9P4IGQ4_9PEZI|nr:MFS general substrate transporter [Rhizodiscina lignyota]